jgi:hypothetical protein
MSELKLGSDTGLSRTNAVGQGPTPSLGAQSVSALDRNVRNFAQRELAGQAGVIDREKDQRLEAALLASEQSTRPSLNVSTAKSFSVNANTPARDIQFQTEVSVLLSESKKSGIGGLDESSLFAVVNRMYPQVSQEQLRNITRNNKNASAEQLLNLLRDQDQADRGVYQATDRTISSAASGAEIRDRLKVAAQGGVVTGLQATKQAASELIFEAADSLTGGALSDVQQTVKTEGTQGVVNKVGRFFGGLWSSTKSAVVSTAVAVKDAHLAVAEKYAEVAVATGKALSDPKTYVRAAQAVVSTVDTLGELAYDATAATLELGRDVIVGTGKALWSGTKATFNWCTDFSARWDNVKSICSGAKDLVVSAGCAVGRGISAAWNYATDLEARGRDLVALGTKVVSGTVAAYNWCTDIDARYQDLKSLGNKAYDLATNPQTWKTLGTALLYATPGVGQAYFAYKMCTDEGYRDSVINGVKTAGKFAYSVCESLGLVQLVKGAGYLVTTPARAIYEAAQFGVNVASDFAKVATGQMTAEEYKASFKKHAKEGLRDFSDHLSQGRQALVGAVMMAGEVTGITDVVMTVKYAAQGNWVMAGMHAGFALMSAGSLTATVMTGGAAVGAVAGVATLKTTAKAAAKQVLESAVKNFGSEIAEGITKEVTQELGQSLVKAGGEIAESAAKSLEKEVLSQGPQALTKETTQRICHEAGTKLLREQFGDRIAKYVENITHDRLKALRGMSQDELVQELQRMGVEMPAKEMNKIAKSFGRALKTSESDEQLVKNLTEAIEKPLGEAVEKLVVEGFQPAFREALSKPGPLREALETRSKIIAKQTGEKFDDVFKKQLDDYVEAGTSGVRKAVREVVHEAVEKGVKQAIKRLRHRDLGGDSAGSEIEVEQYDADLGEGREVEQLAAERAAEKAKSSKSLADAFGLRSFSRTREVINSNGQAVLVTEFYTDRDEDGIYEMIRSEESAISDRKEKSTHEEQGNIFYASTVNEVGQKLECVVEKSDQGNFQLLGVRPERSFAESRTRELV